MPKLETVKVVNESFESGFMVINKADFDKDKHELFDYSKSQDKKLNAKDAVELISQCEDLESLAQFAEDDRKSVKEAFEAKKAELESE